MVSVICMLAMGTARVHSPNDAIDAAIATRYCQDAKWYSDDDGTNHPVATIIDDWGKLTGSDGVLLSNDPRQARVAASQSSGDHSGPGWSLELADDMQLVPGDKSGSFTIEPRGA